MDDPLSTGQEFEYLDQSHNFNRLNLATKLSIFLSVQYSAPNTLSNLDLSLVKDIQIFEICTCTFFNEKLLHLDIYGFKTSVIECFSKPTIQSLTCNYSIYNLTLKTQRMFLISLANNCACLLANLDVVKNRDLGR